MGALYRWRNFSYHAADRRAGSPRSSRELSGRNRPPRPGAEGFRATLGAVPGCEGVAGDPDQHLDVVEAAIHRGARRKNHLVDDVGWVGEAARYRTRRLEFRAVQR